MILLFAACVSSIALGPVTGVAGVVRAGTGDLGGAPGADTARVAIIDDQLRTRVVPFVRLRSGSRGAADEAVILDNRGGTTTLSVGMTAKPGGLLALAPDWWVIDDAATVASLSAPTPIRRAAPTNGAPDPETSAAWIDLVDGQRFVGRLATLPGAGASDEQALRWEHPRLGTLSIELDAIRQLVRDPAATSVIGLLSGGRTVDSVWLTNGDHFDGFVEGISASNAGDPTSASVLITPGGGPGGKGSSASPVRIGFDQIGVVAFANPMKPTATGRSRLWLGDGSILSVDQIEVDAPTGRVTLASSTLPGERDGPGASLELNQLRAVAIDGARLAALAQQPIHASGPMGDRRMAPECRVVPIMSDGPTPFGADDVVLPGPMFVEWTLPSDAARLAGWVTLDPAASAWGDCEVRIVLKVGEGPDRELSRSRISSAAPVFGVNVVLPTAGTAGSNDARRLRIELLAGERGPVQDRVLLKRMLMLTGSPTLAPGPR